MAHKIVARIVTGYARMWPRKILTLRDKTMLEEIKRLLSGKGVYILYRNDQPYYIGQVTRGSLFKRVHTHATRSRRRYYNFWNFFSAFQCVDDKDVINEVEGILIASVPSENRAVPKIRQIYIPTRVIKSLGEP